MKFSKESILDLDVRGLSDFERQELIERFFPEEETNWQKDLRNIKEVMRTEPIRNAYLGLANFGRFDFPYRATMQRIQWLAESEKVSGGHELGNRVTDFTKWLMSLYLTQNPSSHSRKMGKKVEGNVARMAEPLFLPDWELLFRDPLSSKPEPLRISSLQVNGRPIWGVPDVVYHNKKTGEIIIVERKASNAKIPEGGWPNLRAQLWAYAHADRWIKSIEKITLVGEIWNLSSVRLNRRAVLRWNILNKDFYEENAKLFQLYGGVIEKDVMNELIGGVVKLHRTQNRSA